MYFKAFYVLTAYIEYEIYLGAEVFCSGIVCNCLHNAHIHTESIFDKLFAVAGDGAARNCNSVFAQAVNSAELFFYNIHGIAVVGGVVGVENFLSVRQQNKLCRCTSAVNTDICLAGIVLYVQPRYVGACMALLEHIIFAFGFKKRRQS